MAEEPMRPFRFRALLYGISTIAIGCNISPPTPVHRPDPHERVESVATMTPDAKIAELFAQYNRLPVNEKDSLKGDKLMMQIELMLGSASKEMRQTVALSLKNHNRKEIERAMADTSADPDKKNEEAEILAPPRENK
jgi:hypothetical protein